MMVTLLGKDPKHGKRFFSTALKHLRQKIVSTIFTEKLDEIKQIKTILSGNGIEQKLQRLTKHHTR